MSAGPERRLDTLVQPADANHTFSGVASDLVSHSLEDVLVSGLVIGGELGRVRVYWKAGSWKADPGFRRPEQWQLVFDGDLQPSLSRHVVFQAPQLLKSSDVATIYVHSALHNDRGIAYNSFFHDRIRVAHNEDLSIYPGQARIGVEPFGDGGWHRPNRGFSGTVVYRAIPLHYDTRRHAAFPRPLRDAVFTLLLCHSRRDCVLSVLPWEILVAGVLERLYWRDFCVDTPASQTRAANSWWRSCWSGLWRRISGYHLIEDP